MHALVLFLPFGANSGMHEIILGSKCQTVNICVLSSIIHTNQTDRMTSFWDGRLFVQLAMG